jgi:hypothetical protein
MLRGAQKHQSDALPNAAPSVSKGEQRAAGRPRVVRWRGEARTGSRCSRAFLRSVLGGGERRWRHVVTRPPFRPRHWRLWWRGACRCWTIGPIRWGRRRQCKAVAHLYLACRRAPTVPPHPPLVPLLSARRASSRRRARLRNRFLALGDGLCVRITPRGAQGTGGSAAMVARTVGGNRTALLLVDLVHIHLSHTVDLRRGGRREAGARRAAVEGWGGRTGGGGQTLVSVPGYWHPARARSGEYTELAETDPLPKFHHLPPPRDPPAR